MRSYLSNLLTEWLTYEPENIGPPLCDFDRIRYEVRPCDVLLIEGRSKVSEVVSVVTRSPWSHACLYLGRIHDIDDPKIRNTAREWHNGAPNDQLIIEGFLGKGVVIEPLNLYKDAHIRICRPRSISREDAQKVMAYAISQLGQPYDTRLVFDLMRLLIPFSIIPRRFWSSIFKSDMEDSKKLICSSLIAEAFQSVKFPILPIIRHDEASEEAIELIKRNARVHVPSDFDYSPYFDIIKYPFLKVHEELNYRELPWNQDLISYDGEAVSPVDTPGPDDDPNRANAVEQIFRYFMTNKPVENEK